jgi:predicted dehydrogenase
MKKFAAAVTEPLFVHYRVNAGFIPADHWVQDPARGGGRLIGEGVHFIDFVSWLVGAMPTGVEARALPDGGRYTKDNFTITLQFANGSLAQIDYLANGHRALGKERIEMHGGGHSAVLEDFRSLRLMGGRTSSSRLWLGADKGHAAECRAFVNAVRADGAAPIPFADIAAVMRAAFLAHAQLSPAARAVVGGR